MDLDQLTQIINDNTVGNVLTLNSTILASSEITQLFETYLANQQLMLNSITTTSSVQNSSVVINGIGANLPFTGMTVQITLSIVNGTTELLLSADASVGWTLPNSFPAWQHKFFPELQFHTPPQLQLSTSHASATTHYGLYFHGMLDAISVLGPFIWLFSGQAQMLLQGAITLDADGPQTVLSTDPTPALTLGFFALAPVSIEVSTDVETLKTPSPLRSPVFLRFKTGIQLQAGGATLTIPLSADFYGQDLITFNADLNQIINASLHELSSLLNGIDIGKPDLLPPGLALENVIKLKYLTFQVSPTATNKLQAVSIGVEKQGAWNITDTIVMDSIWVSFALNDPMGTKYLSVAAYGVLSIGGGKLDLNAVYPGFAFSGLLEEGTEINLLEIIDYFVGTSATSDEGLDALDIVDCNVSLQLSPLSYAADILLEGRWFINLINDVFLELKDLSFSLNKPAGSGATGSLAGTISIAGVDISISASHPDADGGWIFDGSTGQGQAIPIGTLIGDMVNLFGSVTLPAAIADLTIENLHVRFNTNTTDFLFTCEGTFPVGEKSLTITVTIDLKYGANDYTKSFGGHITFGTLTFDLHFVQSAPSTLFVATYSHSGAPQSISIKDLIAYASSTTANFIPADLQIDLKDVIFAVNKNASGTAFLFGLDISAHIPSLSNLPLVGKELPADQTIQVNDLQILIASNELQQDLVTSLNNLIPDGVTKLAGTSLSVGLTLAASITFGNTPQILAVPVVGAGTPSTVPVPTPPAVTVADDAKWFTLQKAFGPVHVNRVGVKYQDGIASFLLDASLVVAGLTLSLDGLSFGSSLSKFDPHFDLRGLGVDYRAGAVEVGGAFLRTKGKLPDGTMYDEYDGLAIVKTKALTLSAIGSYAILPAGPSLFIYAVLDYPLGGPSFFFITGLAAGFGYNRSLTIPPVDQVAQFPLVAAAVNSASPPQSTQDLSTELTQLARYIHPEVGEIFFAIGIKFTSFKIIDSFVLLTVAFGNEFEIDVLGLSTLILPPPIPGETITPLAVVQMALKVSFIPAQGFLGVSAQLTSASYLLSSSCHLTGGFAFYAWFAGEHSGDFVQTLGGYHPSFVVPDYYPRVPRLGYNWQVDEQLSIKGESYFALTASVLMAGLHIQATWNSGNLQAWFNLVVDFIIAWKPFHYDAFAHADMGVSYTFEFFGTHHLTFDVGADLHIWGPDFTGQAHINLDIISFDVSFGNSSAQLPEPISWTAFKQSFLPVDSAICSIAVTAGLVSKQANDATDLGVINPKDFRLVTDAILPSNAAHIQNDLTVSPLFYTDDGAQGVVAPFGVPSTGGTLTQIPPPGAKTKPIGSPAIGPMGVQSGQLSSTHSIVITRGGSNVEREFMYTPILKNVPVGLWGASVQPNVNDPRFVADALSGFEIRPAVPATPGETAPIERSKLQFDPETIPAAYNWTQNPLTFQPDTSLDEAGRRQKISTSLIDPAVVVARQQLCAALGISADSIDLDQTTANEIANGFLFAPQVEKV